MSTRRTFIKKSCTACVGLLAATSLASLLNSCASLPVYSTMVENNVIRVPLESIGPEEKMKIVRSKSLAYDVLLIIKDDKMHKSFLMKCTHQDNVLVANSNGLTCNLHGSTFNLNGKATKGPATRPLISLQTTEENNFIIINLA